MEQKLYHDYIQILKEELVPAMGCTEPIALAYAAAKAREVLGCQPDRVVAQVSGSIVKNVKSVIVPNTDHMLRKAFPEAKFVDISPLFVTARSVKMPDEIQMFRTLCTVADEGFYQVSRIVRPGVSEQDLVNCFRRSVIDSGFCAPSSWSMKPKQRGSWRQSGTKSRPHRRIST